MTANDLAEHKAQAATFAATHARRAARAEVPGWGAASDDLTTRQRELYAWYYEQARDRGYQPSVREMGAAFGLTSPNGIHIHMRAWARKGYVAEPHGAKRALRFLRKPNGQKFDGFADKEG
jgi:hypothetical protein